MIEKCDCCKKEIQYDEYLSLDDLKPEISKNGIYFPVSVEHVDVNKFGGDGRSFGYEQDEGHCTVVKYEQAVGVLAEDTIELFLNCENRKRSMKKPHHSNLEITISNDKSCDTKKSELLIRYDDEYFYRDENGYFFKTEYFCYGEPQRVTNESAEIYREVNKEYQRQIKKYNKMMNEALSNIEILKAA